jgi:hypothetical protein
VTQHDGAPPAGWPDTVYPQNVSLICQKGLGFVTQTIGFAFKKKKQRHLNVIEF